MLTAPPDVTGARWTSLYDVRAELGGGTGEKSKKPTLQLVCNANIQQNTGEDWSGVALTLSTALPRTDTRIPTISPVRVRPAMVLVGAAASTKPRKKRMWKARFVAEEKEEEDEEGLVENEGEPEEEDGDEDEEEEGEEVMWQVRSKISRHIPL